MKYRTGLFFFLLFLLSTAALFFVLLELSQIQTRCRCPYCSPKRCAVRALWCPLDLGVTKLVRMTDLPGGGGLLARHGHYSPPVLLKLMAESF